MQCDTSPGPETHVEYIDLCDYIFKITACFPRILVYCHIRCTTAQVQERGSVTTLTQCTCHLSAGTLYFFPLLFTHLSPPDISDETVLFVQHSLLIDSVSSTLLPACLNGAVWLLSCNTATRWQNWALQVGTLCHLKKSKDPFNVSQTDFKRL